MERPLLLTIGAALLACVFTLPIEAHAQSFTDVTAKTFERAAITGFVERGWMFPHAPTTFGYGQPITPEEWRYLLMFLRTDDACPEFGMTATAHWTAENISACLFGAGVPVQTERPDRIRRDEAMQQLFALRRRGFAFQDLEARPTGFVEPKDIAEIPEQRTGAMIAADRLKLLFRTSNALLPAAPLLREDAALSVSRFMEWEAQGGTDKETEDETILSKDAVMSHWRDLDTDIYVIRMKTGGDTIVKPIVPRRSFFPSENPNATSVRREFVYEPVSSLAKDSGAIAAVNGSYFNTQEPWGAFEDVAMVDGAMILERTDRSTFIVCKNGLLYIGTYQQKALGAKGCVPQHMLGAGPLFLSDGAVLTESTKEGFDEYTQWERRVGTNARTAVGISADRKTLYLIVVAGKSYPAFGKGGVSLGGFLKERYPDIAHAMMYDGGGSSTLVAKGRVLVGMGVSGSRSERPVISALGIFSKKAEQTRPAAEAKERARRWDPSKTTIRIELPKTLPVWQTAKQAKDANEGVVMSGTRGSSIQLVDAKKKTHTFSFIFDRLLREPISGLTLTRREGKHDKGWMIPTELRILDPRDQSNTDVIRLLSLIPAAQRPDLKTFDVVAFRPTGVVFGDGSGRHWFYYAKQKQLSPAVFTVKK